MKPAVLTIRRSDLLKHNACPEWLAAFDAVCAERDIERVRVGSEVDERGLSLGLYEGRLIERGPLVRRRDGTTSRAATRLRIVLTPLAQVWLCLPLANGGSAWGWLRGRGVVGSVSAPFAYLRGAYLSGADLSGAYLSGADLSGAYLSGAYLSGADLSGAYLSGAYLSGAYLSGAYLSGADLSGADLSGADLSRADLSRADLSGAYLSGANLSGADLSGAYLSGAYLSGAYLSGADLSGAYLSGAYLSGADLSGADRYFDDPAVPGWVVRNGRMEPAAQVLAQDGAR